MSHGARSYRDNEQGQDEVQVQLVNFGQGEVHV